MPQTYLAVVSDRDGLGADQEFVLPARRLPLLGSQEGWTAAAAWLRGLRSLDPGPVDVVASLELYSVGSWQADALSRRLGVPHAVTVFENLGGNPLYRLPPWGLVARRVIRSATLFVCFTRAALDHAVALGCPADRCLLVHPGVDTEAFRPRHAGLPSEPSVLFVGMLRADRGANKGVTEIVAACQRLAADIEGLRLVLVGDGPLRPSLEAHAATLPFLEVLGPRRREEIPTLLRRARVLCLASRRTWKWEEQFSFALVEAMACGLPVVATRSGAIPEVVPDWNPLVPEGDVDALAAGIRAALGVAGANWGRRNRAHVLERFDLRRQGRLLAEALATLGPPHTSSAASRRQP